MAFVLPVAATAIAAAAPAAAAASASVAASAAMAATLTSIASNMLMNFAISSAMAALNPEVGAAGRTFEWTLDPDGPIPFAAGRVGVAGSVVYRETFGPDLMYYGIPSVISGAGPIDGFESFLADDESVTFDGTGKATSSQYAGELWYKTSLGAQPATAITSPSGLKSGATLPGWTSAHKLSGKASYMIVMGENSKGTAFPTGEIKPLVTVRGLKGWDPRKDSTYPGGSGSCRLNTPSTWVYLQNPILWALKWSLGLWEGPTGKGAPQVDYQVGGIGAKLSGIDVPAFVAAANVADANGWTVAAYPTTDDDKAQVLDAFLQAGGATYAQRAGKISCIQRAAPRTSIVTISGRDTAGPLEIDTAASRIDRINTIRPRYWSEAHRWQLTALPEVTASAYQTQDGGKRTRGIDYPYVTNPVQAAQLAALQIANTREGIAGVIPLKPHLQRIRPGDAFTITEEDFVLNGVKCLCLNTDYDPATGIVRVSFVSETDAKYPFALGQSPDVPVPPVLTPVDNRYVRPPAPEDWTVVVTPPAPGGTLVPGIDLTGLVTNATADAMLISWRVVAEGEDPAVAPVFLNEDKEIVPGWVDAGIWPPTTQSLTIQGPQSGAVVWIAIRYQRGNNVSLPDLRGPLTVGILTAGDVAPGSNFFDTVRDLVDAAVGDYEPPEIDELRADLDAQIAAARDEAEAGIATEGAARVAALAAETLARIAAINAEALARGTAISGVNTAIASVASALAAETTNRTDQYSALNGSIAAVSTSVSTVATNLAAETATRTTQYSSLGTSIAAVDTRVTTVATDLAAETSTRSSQTSSLAGSISFINSYVDTVASALAAETTARTTQGSTLNDAIATVTSSVSTVASNLAAETTTRTTQYSSLGTSIATVDGRVTTVATDLSAEVTTRSAQTASLNGSISFINGYVDTVASALSAETTARTSQGSTLAGSIAGVSTSVSTVATNLAAETSTRSSQYSSLSGSVATVDGRVTTVANDLAAETTARNTQASSIGGSISFLSSYIETVATAQSATAVTVSNLSATVGSHTASIAAVSSVAADAQGKINAVWSLNVTAGRTAGIIAAANGATATLDLVADYFRLRPLSGTTGVDIDGLNGVIKLRGSTRRLVLKTSGIIMWVGPSSVSDGSETLTNGILGISETDGFFGGKTLSGPFDSGLQSGGVTLSTSAYVEIASIGSKQVRDGQYLTWPAFSFSGQGTIVNPSDPTPERIAVLNIAWRVVSTNQAGVDLEVLETGSASGSTSGGSTSVTAAFSAVRSAFQSVAGAKTGDRRIVLEAKIGTSGTTAVASNRRLSGFYAA